MGECKSWEQCWMGRCSDQGSIVVDIAYVVLFRYPSLTWLFLWNTFVPSKVHSFCFCFCRCCRVYDALLLLFLSLIPVHLLSFAVQNMKAILVCTSLFVRPDNHRSRCRVCETQVSVIS